MGNFRPLLAAAALAIGGTVLLAAQAAPADTSADVLVLDYDFASGGGEYARVFLEAGQVYRAELNSADATLVIRAVGGRIRAPRIYPVLSPDSPSEASVAELYPDQDAEYEIRPVPDGIAGGIATRLRLYRDVRASHRRLAVRSRPAWGIGFELAGTWVGGFSDENDALGASSGHTGSMVETCFSARPPRGGGLCVFGIGYQSQAGTRDVVWFFTEPRVRLLGIAAPGQSGWELGALLRAGFGSIERVSKSPFMVAPGAYVARQIRTGDHGGGWTIQGSYSHGFYSGFGAPGSLVPEAQPHSDGFTLRLGWYQ